MEGADFQIKIVNYAETFENLLANDRLFVDYFNSFLVLPTFSQRVKFNYETGELEILEENEENYNYNSQNNSDLNSDLKEGDNKKLLDHENVTLKKRSRTEKSILKRSSSSLSSRGENVKRSLEKQLKSIIKNHEKKSIPKNEPKSAALLNYKKFSKEAFNHSFKDIELIPITALIEPADRKDPKAASESRVSIVNTNYSVRVLKKPQSMKWLRVRRLSLFLQSLYYSEYKIAKLLSQCKLDANGTSNVFQNTSKALKFFKVELDQELDEMNFNPFKAKSELQKLKDYSNKFENNVNENEVEIKTQKVSRRKSKDAEKNSKVEYNKINDEEEKHLEEKYQYIEKKALFRNENDIYRTLPYKELHSQLIFNKNKIPEIPKHHNLVEKKEISKNEIENEKTSELSEEQLNDIAKNIVDSILQESIEEITNPDYKRHDSLKDDESLDNSFDEKSEFDQLSIDGEDDDVELYFEDESFQLKISYEAMMKQNFVKKESIDSFKSFLKETDGDLFFRIWMEIETLAMLTNENEKKNELKKFKINYNRPEIMKKLQKLKHNNKINVDFWSLDHLADVVQKTISNEMVVYWFPKYLVHLHSIKKLNSDHYYKNTSIFYKQKLLNDFQVQNIEKSITSIEGFNNFNKIDQMLEFKRKKNSYFFVDRDSIKESYKKRQEIKELNAKIPYAETNFYKIHKNDSIDVKKEYSSLSDNNEIVRSIFETSPPTGYKRPYTGPLKPILKPIKNDIMISSENFDKDVYLEAISQDQASGRVFMKYLQSTNKIFSINRFKCLQELIKFKELFYDENFNQTIIKKLALEIYTKYIAVSASETIDCEKADRIKIHTCFVEENKKKFYSPEASSNFLNITLEGIKKPLYEDTFDFIEEFLCDCLFDEWKAFIKAENNLFDQIEIGNIEREVKIKSKKIEELRRKGVLRLTQKISTYTFTVEDMKFLEKDGLKKKSKSRTSKEDTNESVDPLNFDMYKLMKDKKNLENFKEFMRQNYAIMDLECWIDIESFMSIDPSKTNEIDEKARYLRKKYLSRRYLFGPNSPVDEETQNKILEKIGGWNIILLDKPPNTLIELAKKHVENKLETVWLPEYFNSDSYKQKIDEKRTRMSDVVDDVLYLKNRIDSDEDKIKNRWLFSSKVVINFRKSLKNQFTLKSFRNYLQLHKNEDLGLTSDTLINNLTFLLDVQEYKELCQKQADDITLLNKVKHIVDSYINNALPPKIQIDINTELAHKIIDECDFLSPYLFLEAYLTVFFSLLPLWVKFDQLRSAKSLETSEYDGYKKVKDYKQTDSSLSFSFDFDKDKNKWRNQQYMKILKTQIII